MSASAQTVQNQQKMIFDIPGLSPFECQDLIVYYVKSNEHFFSSHSTELNSILSQLTALKPLERSKLATIIGKDDIANLRLLLEQADKFIVLANVFNNAGRCWMELLLMPNFHLKRAMDAPENYLKLCVAMRDHNVLNKLLEKLPVPLRNTCVTNADALIEILSIFRQIGSFLERDLLMGYADKIELMLNRLADFKKVINALHNPLPTTSDQYTQTLNANKTVNAFFTLPDEIQHLLMDNADILGQYIEALSANDRLFLPYKLYDALKEDLTKFRDADAPSSSAHEVDAGLSYVGTSATNLGFFSATATISNDDDPDLAEAEKSTADMVSSPGVI